MRYIATIDDRTFEIDVNETGEIIADGQRLEVDFQSVAEEPIYSMLLEGDSYEANVYGGDEAIEVLLRGQLYVVRVEDERQRRLRESSGEAQLQEGEYNLKAPMPGMVVEVPVQEGQEVERGDNLIILESMKMQNELRAPRDGTVSRVRVSSGDSVDRDEILLTLT